jgi:beta-galactosidase
MVKRPERLPYNVFRLTRRDFLSDTAFVAAASALGVATPVTAATTPPGKTQSIATRRSNFDQQWRFFQGDPPDADKVTFDDAAWRTLDLPHDWSIEGPFDEHAPAKGNGRLPTHWNRLVSQEFRLTSVCQAKANRA